MAEEKTPTIKSGEVLDTIELVSRACTEPENVGFVHFECAASGHRIFLRLRPIDARTIATMMISAAQEAQEMEAKTLGADCPHPVIEDDPVSPVSASRPTGPRQARRDPL